MNLSQVPFFTISLAFVASSANVTREYYFSSHTTWPSTARKIVPLPSFELTNVSLWSHPCAIHQHPSVDLFTRLGDHSNIAFQRWSPRALVTLTILGDDDDQHCRT